MENQDSHQQQQEYPITKACRNFKNYLKEKFDVNDFGNFIYGSTFSLKKFKKARREALAIKKPKYFRIYYGCDESGENHTLYIAFLDKCNNVILMDKLREAPLEQDGKCPPADPCRNDMFIGNL